MSDSQQQEALELTARQLQRVDKLPTPVLSQVASPSPAKARRRPATERPSLPTGNVAPVKLPSELFAIATSRGSQGDLALSKALDGIQAAVRQPESFAQSNGRAGMRATARHATAQVHPRTALDLCSVSVRRLMRSPYEQTVPEHMQMMPKKSLPIAQATRLETERTKLVIQSQELQIWDMAREEELVLLKVRRRWRARVRVEEWRSSQRCGALLMAHVRPLA
jgi:hypothetical protein